MNSGPLRNRISPRHPVFGGCKKLADHDCLLPADETARVSMLLTLEGDRWIPVLPGWSDRLGMTIGSICDDFEDADGDDRVFRRKC
jgi:hypothetical protein